MTTSSQRRFRPAVHRLEDRELPANLIAASVADLISAINAANATPEADTITLVAGKTFTLTAVNNTTDGATGLPVIAPGENLTIIGNADIIERSTGKGTPAFRLFDVAAGGSLTAKSLTLQGGLAYGAIPFRVALGGAVLNLGSLTLDGVMVQNNTAHGFDATKDGSATDALGGGLYSGGSLVVTRSTIRNNATIGGRGQDGNTYLWGGTGWGGGVYVGGGTASIDNSAITGNTARGGAGGDLNTNGSDKPKKGDGWGQGGGWLSPTGGRGGNALGGGLFVSAGGTVTLSNTSVTGNAAVGGGGGLGDTASPDGPDGNGFGGGLCIASPATVILDAYSLAHVVGNTATFGEDIYGPYDVIS
jgi:hypothetical protein